MSNMQYKTMGRTGLKVSRLGFGTWATFHNQADMKDAKQLLVKARQAGINFFDTAEGYAYGRAEEIMGQAIKELSWKRSDVVISTKIFWGGPEPNDKGLSKKHIIEGMQASLKRLEMDYVDVLFCHRPDVSTPIEETVRAMNYVIDNGWAFYWGTSEWSAQQITEAWEVARRLGLIGPIVEQPEYSFMARDKVEVEYLPLYNSYGLGLTTWGALASGVLTGKYSQKIVPPDSRFALENRKVLTISFLCDIECFTFLFLYQFLGALDTFNVFQNTITRYMVDDIFTKVDNLKPIADELKVPLSRLATAWCASNPNVSTVIVGASKESQLVDNLKALDIIPMLTSSILDRIEAVVQTKPKKLYVY
ncbi:hypothetical protein O6H91_04G114000 [Diphasiastrum complanatum]|uniref:Uncharacterized protein n=1 Tax=Diphasiastrum complanatum TaxID=34168 RepID=A0ACC2E100_DIPCM|nr:hypothetical protein O6H91_04G114000 [Diphasiastrum complanatum]